MTYFSKQNWPSLKDVLFSWVKCDLLFKAKLTIIKECVVFLSKMWLTFQSKIDHHLKNVLFFLKCDLLFKAKLTNILVRKTAKIDKKLKGRPFVLKKKRPFFTVLPRVLFKKLEFLLKSSFALGKQVKVVFFRKNESDLNLSVFLLNTLENTTSLTRFLDCFFSWKYCITLGKVHSWWLFLDDWLSKQKWGQIEPLLKQNW